MTSKERTIVPRPAAVLPKTFTAEAAEDAEIFGWDLCV
jgi:hypothetical protein